MSHRERRAGDARQGPLLSQYLDTSLLVSAFTREAATGRVQSWLGRQEARDLVISDWVVTEFSSALSVKLRMKHLNLEQRANAMSLFTGPKERSLTVVAVKREHFMAAARFAEDHGLGLQAGDALHISVAADRGARICTLDKRLADAAAALGVDSLSI